MFRRLPLALSLSGLSLVFTACTLFQNPNPATSPQPDENQFATEGGAMTHDVTDPKWERFRRLPFGFFPFYVLGDVNDDGQVDSHDLEEITRLAETSAKDTPCLGSADVDQDGQVTAKDVARVAGWLEQANPVTGPAIDWYSQLPCGFKQPRVAGELLALAGGKIDLVLLRKDDSVATVEAELETGAFSMKPLSDGTGYRVSIPADAQPGDRTWVRFFFPDGNVYLHTITVNKPRLVVSSSETVPTPFPTTEVRESPSPVPSPPEEDEDIPPKFFPEDGPSVPPCPQFGKGCSALVVDLLVANDWGVPTFRGTKDRFQKLGCDVTYIAPTFEREPDGFLTLLADAFDFNPPADVARIRQQNEATWQALQKDLDAYRAKMASGREMVVQAYLAHGTEIDGEACGYWTPGFYAGFALDRTATHTGNFKALQQNSCLWHVTDVSCFSGLTSQSVDNLENRASGVCNFGSTDNHAVHGPYWGTTAAGTSSSTVDTPAEVGFNRVDGFKKAMTDEYEANGKQAPANYTSLFRRWRQEAKGLGSIYRDRGQEGCTLDPGHVRRGY